MEERSVSGGPVALRYRASRAEVFQLDHGRIEHLVGDEGGWALSYTPWGSSREFVTYHRRLSSARAWATHYDRLSARRSNRIRHGLLAVVLAAAAMLLVVFIIQGLGIWGVVVFVFVATSWFFALHEFADLLDAIVPDDASDAVDRRMLWLDPMLSHAMQRLEAWFGLSPPWILDEGADSGRVALPPWPVSFAAQISSRGRS